MEFNPTNPIIQLCLQGMAMEEQGKSEEACTLFKKAWNEATNDFEKYLAAHYLARNQKNNADKLHWLQTTLKLATNINNITTKSAFPSLHTNIAKCYKDIGDTENENKYLLLASSFVDIKDDKGPFYHGTKADLKVGDLLIAGGLSNYKSKLKMNHIYFTAIANTAGLAAALANGDGPERVYIVEPTGSFENDPNVTDKKFPGNPTRSYRSEAPLKIIGEVNDWIRQTPEQIQQWKEKLKNNKGEIIN